MMEFMIMMCVRALMCCCVEMCRNSSLGGDMRYEIETEILD